VPKTEEIATWLADIGCPREKCVEMAKQLEKRAQQLADRKNKTVEEALAHLLQLMQQGWAAQGTFSKDQP